MLAGRYGESRRLAEDGLALARRLELPLEEAEILGTLGVDLALLGDADAAVAALDEAVEVGREGRAARGRWPGPGSTGPRCWPGPLNRLGEAAGVADRRPRPAPPARSRPLLRRCPRRHAGQHAVPVGPLGRRRPRHRGRPGRAADRSGRHRAAPGPVPAGRRAGSVRRRPRRPRTGGPPLDPGRRPPLPGAAAHAGGRAWRCGRAGSARPGRPWSGRSTSWSGATTSGWWRRCCGTACGPKATRRSGPGRSATASRPRPPPTPPPASSNAARALQQGAAPAVRPVVAAYEALCRA